MRGRFESQIACGVGLAAGGVMAAGTRCRGGVLTYFGAGLYDLTLDGTGVDPTESIVLVTSQTDPIKCNVIRTSATVIRIQSWTLADVAGEMDFSIAVYRISDGNT